MIGAAASVGASGRTATDASGSGLMLAAGSIIAKYHAKAPSPQSITPADESLFPSAGSLDFGVRRLLFGRRFGYALLAPSQSGSEKASPPRATTRSQCASFFCC